MTRSPGRPAGSYTQAGRLFELERLVWAAGRITVTALARELGVSTRSVRRDLVVLLRAGRGLRVEACVVSLTPKAFEASPGVRAVLRYLRRTARAAGPDDAVGSAAATFARSIAAGELVVGNAAPQEGEARDG